jgi:hypothetical protein
VTAPDVPTDKLLAAIEQAGYKGRLIPRNPPK